MRSDHSGRRSWKYQPMRPNLSHLVRVVERDGMSHRDFAATDGTFRTVCAAAGVEPTRRQAGRWHQKRGRAFAARVAGQSAGKVSA